MLLWYGFEHTFLWSPCLQIPRYGAVGLSGVGHGVWCSFRLPAPQWQQVRLLTHEPGDLNSSAQTKPSQQRDSGLLQRFRAYRKCATTSLVPREYSQLAVLYSSLILATLLWCTILIVYRILRVGGAAGRMHVYQRLIEMLVESALLYSAVIIVVLVFEVRNEVTAGYVQELAIAMRVRLVHFHFYLCHKYNVSSRASRLQFWLAALQQGMHVQTTPGAKAPLGRHFGSEVIQVRITTAR